MNKSYTTDQALKLCAGCRAGLTQNNSSSNNNSSGHNAATPSPPPKTKSEPRSSLDPLNSSRMRPDAENQGAPPAKRSRPSAASRAHAANHTTAGGGGVDDDDIQEVVPVKAEPTGAGGGGVGVGSVSGTMAMYDEGTEEGEEGLLGYEDSNYQEEEEEEYGEYGEAEQYNMAGGAQDASSGRREARVLTRLGEPERIAAWNKFTDETKISYCFSDIDCFY